MTDQATRVRTEVTINDTPFLMAEGQDLNDLKRRIEDASQPGGRFVDFVIAGDRSISVLITAASRVVVTVDIVPLDIPSIAGEDEYDGTFDYDGFPAREGDVPTGW